jgi:glycosyltransferase involved in cell wall biosynthesis
MARAVSQQSALVDVATTDDAGPGARLAVARERFVETDGYRIIYFPKQTDFYLFSLAFWRWIFKNAKNYDLLHIHALFSFTSTAAAFAAYHSETPYIVRPLGVLNSWGIKNRRRALKAISFRIFEDRILRHAAAMHYTSRAEFREAQKAGATATPHVIPLGINAEPFLNLPGPEVFHTLAPQSAGREVVLFLSRLDPKKGLDLLLPAFAKVHAKRPSALLVIAGSGEIHFVANLKKIAAAFGISEHIVWAGHLAGTAKLSALRAASLFVLPSYSENFGIALVEALAAGLPCVTTRGVAIHETIQQSEAGMVVDSDPEAIATAVLALLADRNSRENLSKRARALAVREFTLESMGTQLLQMYTQLSK